MYKKSKQLNPHIRKTAQLLGAPRFRGALPPNLYQWLCPLTPLGDPSPKHPGGLQLPQTSTSGATTAALPHLPAMLYRGEGVIVKFSPRICIDLTVVPDRGWGSGRPDP